MRSNASTQKHTQAALCVFLQCYSLTLPKLTLQVRSLKEQHAEELAMQRRAAEAHTAQRVAENEALITKTLNQEHKRKMTQVHVWGVCI